MATQTSFDPTLWQDFVDAMVQRLGPHAADALNRFRTRVRGIVRGLAAQGVSAVLIRACARPAVGVAYLQLLSSMGITPEPPSPEFIERLIDDALA